MPTYPPINAPNKSRSDTKLRSPVRLFCIPFAGGNSYSYRDLQKHAGTSVELLALEMPGRGRRFGEPLLTSLDEMVYDLFAQTAGQLDEPFAIYGHSMGARLGCLLVRHLLAQDLPIPQHLFVSGCSAPSAAKKCLRHLLPQADFITMLQRMDCPPEVLRDEELMEVFEPVLRADFEANDTFEYRRLAPFAVPITVMIGTQEQTSRDDALRWQEETTGEFSFEELAGGHFFIFDHLPALGRTIAVSLATGSSASHGFRG